MTGGDDSYSRAWALARAGQDIAESNAMIDSMLVALRRLELEVPSDVEVRVSRVLMYLAGFDASVDGALLVLAVALDRLARCAEPSS